MEGTKGPIQCGPRQPSTCAHCCLLSLLLQTEKGISSFYCVLYCIVFLAVFFFFIIFKPFNTMMHAFSYTITYHMLLSHLIHSKNKISRDLPG